MSDMKCPYCGEKLQQTYSFNPKQFWCSNYYDHKHPINLQGTKELWQELIRTRKALDVAVDALKSAHDYYEYCIQRDKDYGGDDINWDCTAMNMDNDISDALEQITALEQKDVK